MPEHLCFIPVGMQAFQGHIKSPANKIVPGMFSCITCLAFLFSFLISCKDQKTIPKPGHPPGLSLSEAKSLLKIYNRCLDAAENSDSFIFRQQYLDSIVNHEQEYVSDSALAVLREAYYNRAYDYDISRNYIAAKNDFEKVLTLAQKIGYDRTRQQFVTLNKLANIYNRFGDINRSFNMRKRQLELSEQTNEISFLVPTYINLGILNAGMGNLSEAIYLFKKGSLLNTIDEYNKGKLLSSLASVYIEGDQPDSAFKYANSSLKLLVPFDEKEDILDWRSDNFLTLAKVYDLKNDTSGKSASFRKAIELAVESSGNERAREIGKIHLTFCTAGKIKEKNISSIHRALYTVSDVDTNNIFSLPSKQELYAENTIMEALDAKAEWMTNYFAPSEKQKYFQCAVDCYDLAFEVERKLLLNFSYDESKIRMLKESRWRSEKAIALCYTLYKETNEEKWIDKAFHFAERNKAFVILESIRRNLAASQVAQHDTLFQKVQQLQMEYSFAEKSLLEAINSNDTSELKKLEGARNKADEQLQLAKTSLYQNNSGYRQWMEKEDSISITMTHELLTDNKSALVEYFIGDSASYAIVAAGKRYYRFVTISNDHLARIDSFQNFFRHKNNIPGSPNAYQQQAYAVYTAWLKPCLEGFTGNKLLIIPDDKLNILPFDALITGISAHNNLQSWNYLVKDYKIDLGYSVSAILKQNIRNENKTGIAAFAPGFINRERNMPALSFTAEEVDNIKKGSRAILYKDKEATLAQFRRSVNEPGIIHIASHARADNAGEIPAIEFIDSALLLNELYAMQVNAGLVVLSACQTGIGKIEKSEGAMSLARGFYYAGAKNIITSLWSINDRSTALLFKNFYGNLEKENYSSALHKGKKDYLSAELTNDKYSPYYWAGFICIGTDGPDFQKEGNRGSFTLLIGLGLAGLIFTWYVLKRNKKR